MLGKRYLANMIRWNTGTTKDNPERERETDGSGEIEITHDETTHGTMYKNILYLDGTPRNIKGGSLQEVGRKKPNLPTDRLSSHALIILWRMD